MIEAGIDQPGSSSARRFLAARDEIEEVAPLFGRSEDEGRGEEYRRLHRTFRQLRVEAVAQHQRFRMQPMISDMGLGRAWGSHDDPPVRFSRPKLDEEPTPVLANFCAMTSDEDPRRPFRRSRYGWVAPPYLM